MSTADRASSVDTDLRLAIAEPELQQEYRAGLAAGELRLQRCTACGYLRVPAASRCPECWSTDSDWITVSGAGTVWSLAEFAPGFGGAAGTAARVVAAVVLDDGPFVIAEVHGLTREPAVGARVAAEFGDASAPRLMFRAVS